MPMKASPSWERGLSRLRQRMGMLKRPECFSMLGLTLMRKI